MIQRQGRKRRAQRTHHPVSVRTVQGDQHSVGEARRRSTEKGLLIQPGRRVHEEHLQGARFSQEIKGWEDILRRQDPLHPDSRFTLSSAIQPNHRPPIPRMKWQGPSTCSIHWSIDSEPLGQCALSLPLIQPGCWAKKNQPAFQAKETVFTKNTLAVLRFRWAFCNRL